MALGRSTGRRLAGIEPSLVPAVLLGAVLVWLVAWPVIQMARGATTGDTWSQVVSGPLSGNLLWQPMRNTVTVGLGVAVLATAIGGGLAWLVVMSDVPARRLLGAMATVPFALPTFSLALAWESIFRNERVGASRAGLLTVWGIDVPDWLAWGQLPVIATLAAHYSSLAFLLIAAALASAGGDLQEAAELTGASRSRIARAITLPAVLPAVIASLLLTFAEGASNFSAPALLGTPVRFQTMSTRIFGSISTGRVERGFAIAILLIVVAGVALIAGTLIQRRRRAAVLSGKGMRVRRVPLGRMRWPVTAAGWGVVAAVTVVPAVILTLASFTRRTGSFSGGFTLHHWMGRSDPQISQGQRGVLRNPVVLEAMRTTLLVSVAVAVIATTFGLLTAYVIRRSPSLAARLSLGGLTFVPFLIPGVALGAVLIGQFGSSFGPLPALYGTPALLILGGAIAGLPYATQAGGASLAQIGNDLEEAAELAGGRFLRRLWSIVLPLILRGLLAGAVLSFVKMARDLDLVALLATPTMTTLSVVTYRYASEGFTQMANAITMMIVVVSVSVTLLARRIEGWSTPWST